MPVNDGSNIRITPFTPMQMPNMAKEVSSLFSAMRRASGGGGGLGGQIMFNPVTNKFERIPGGSFKERQLNMDAMNNMRVQAAWNNSENKNVQAIQKKLQDFENASVERKNQIIDDIRRNDIPKLANDSGIDGRAFIAGPLKDLEQRQQEAAQQVAKTGALDVLWDSARIGLRNFTDSLADLGSNAQEQAARANARQQYIEQVRNENAYLQNSARRQAEGADFMDRFSGREVLAAAGEFAGQNIPTFGAMALGGAIGGALGGAIGLGARGASMVGQAIPGFITGAGQQMTASVDAIMSDTTKTTEQKMQELEDAQTSSRLFGGALGAVVMPVGQGIRRAVSEGLANRGIGGSQVAQTIRNQRAGKALPNEVTSWDEALINARRADIEAENALIRSRRLARFRQQAADSALEGALFGTAGQLGTNVIANDPIGTNMGAATLGGLVGGLGFTPFNRRTLRDVPDAVYNPAVPVNPVRAYQYGPRVNTSVNTDGTVRLNDMLQNATWEQRYDAYLHPRVQRPVAYNTVPGEFGFARSAGEGQRMGARSNIQGFNDIDFMLQRTMSDPKEISPLFNEELYQQDRAAAANAMASARPVPLWGTNWGGAAPVQRPAAARQQPAQQTQPAQQVQQQVAPQAVQPQAAAPSATKGKKARQPKPSEAQQQFIKQNSSPNPPKVDDNQTPASISTSRIPENENGEQGLNFTGPNAFVPKQQPAGDVPRNQPQPSTDKAVSGIIQNILKKWGKYKAGAPKGGLHATSENSINKAVDALTPEQKQALVQTIDSYQGLSNLSKVKYTQRAIQYAYDRAKNPAPVQEGATNAQQSAAQPRPVQGAEAEPAANPAATQQQAANAAAAINTVTGGGGEQTAARLEQSVNAGAPAANRGDTDSDSGGKAVDTGNPATNADSVPQGAPVVRQTTEERGDAGTEAQQSGETPKTEGTPEPKVTEQQAADGERGLEPAATVDAETGEGTGGAGLEGGTGPRNGRNAADAGSNKQPGDESGDGDGAVKVLPEPAGDIPRPQRTDGVRIEDAQQVADSSFNVRVNRDGTITSSDPDWKFNRTDVVREARKLVSTPRGTNNLRVKLRDILSPGRKFNLYTSNIPARPVLTVLFTNATGGQVTVELEHTRGRGRSNGTWAPRRGAEAYARVLTVDNKNQLLIDVSQLPAEAKPLASGDGAQIGLTLNTNGGLEIGDTSFPLYPNEWAIKPTVQETLQAKANRDTAVAAAKDAKDTETSQNLVAPKVEGQDPADAKVLEDLATITKTDAQTPVKTPEQEAAKTPQRRTPRKKADEEQSKTKKKTDDQKSDTKTRRRVVTDTPAEKPAEKPEEPAEQAPANPREEAEAQATAAVESKIDARTESYDYGQEDGTAIISSRLRELQEEQIDDMADRIYELQQKGPKAIERNPVSTDEAPAMVMSYIIDIPANKLGTIIQDAGVRDLKPFRVKNSKSLDPMKVADAMARALIAKNISDNAAGVGFKLDMSETDNALMYLAYKSNLPAVEMSAEERTMLNVWLGDETIPRREKTTRAALDMLMTTPDEARKRILNDVQQGTCSVLNQSKKRAKNAEKAMTPQEAAEAAEKAAEQREIAERNARARQVSYATRTAITNS